MMFDFAVGALVLSAFVVVLCAIDAAAVLWRMWRGEEPVPYRLSRRYWRRKLVRLVCRLAALEAAWEKKKSPRMAATRRGIVGQRVRRSACMYSQIIPQSAGNVKSDFAVRWNWMRG